MCSCPKVVWHESERHQGKAQVYHRYVAKSLFLCKRARSVASLSTRIKAPDADDLKKLQRMMQHLRGVACKVLTLEADSLQIGSMHPMLFTLIWRVTQVRPCPLEKVFYGTSTRQKLNTKSSTEAEFWSAESNGSAAPLVARASSFVDGIQRTESPPSGTTTTTTKESSMW